MNFPASRFRYVIFIFGLVCLLVVFIFCFWTFSSSSENENSDVPNGPRGVPTLKFVAVITRHGNRSPMFGYPTDPYKMTDPTYWPNGGSHDLTSIGRYQMYQLGVRIRELYHGFLNSAYYPGDLYATSTLLNRTILSGLSVLAGMYPPQGFQIWDQDILWQPIPLYIDSPDKSLVYDKCPPFLKDQRVALKEFSDQYATNISALNAIMEPHVGMKVSTAQQLFAVWDSLFCEATEGLSLPDWTKQVYPEPMTSVVAQSFIPTFAKTDTMIRLMMGPFLDNLFAILRRKMEGTLSPGSQIHYFSGHDSSLVALQRALGIPQADMYPIVHPGSAMIFELHQNLTTRIYSVQVVFINGLVGGPPTVFKIPGCGSSCDYDLLVNITKPFCNVDFDTECQLNSTLH